MTWTRGIKPNVERQEYFAIGDTRNIHQCERCGKIPENIKVPLLKYCVTSTALDPKLGSCSPSEFEGILQLHVSRFHNVGGSVFTFNDTSKKEVYRSADLSESPAALKELVKERKVQLIINMHSPARFDLAPWIQKELYFFKRFGGGEYITVPDFNYKFYNEMEKQKIFHKIAEIIRLIMQCEGNVLIHCGGGEHRTGIIYAILHKCFHDFPLETILQEYKCHCAWKSVHATGGYNEKNVELIRDFPIELVKQ